MNQAEYNAAEKRNDVAFQAAFLLFIRQYQGRELQEWQWYAILGAIYPLVEQYRYESARLGRLFYDSERERRLRPAPSSRQLVVDLDQLTPASLERAAQTPPTDTYQRHDIYLAPYKPEWFIEAMEPVKDEFSSGLATDKTIDKVTQRALKEVRAGGRQTIIQAARTDPNTPNGTPRPRRKRPVAWARVAGGGESCGFCAMLISRGPVYDPTTPSNAGLNVSNMWEGLRVWEQYEKTGDEAALLGMMNKWHPNCDCTVVPVFDAKEWPGRDEFLDMRRLWNQVTKGKASGQRRLTSTGRFTPTGGDKLIAFRRALGDGYKIPAPGTKRAA